MKPSFPTYLTHGGAVLAGIALAAALIARPSGNQAPSPDAPIPGKPASAQQGFRTPEDIPADIAAMDDTALRNLSSKDYRAAWKAIARKKVPIKERIRLQREILEHWAMKDLKGALQAAYDGQWDGADTEGGIGALVEAFLPAFQQQPLEAWQLLHSDDFVLASKLFEKDWLDAACDGRPEIVATLIHEMTPELAARAVEMVASGKMDFSVRASLLDAIARMPGYADVGEMLNTIMEYSPSTGSPDSLRDKVMSAAREPDRTIALHEFVSSIWNAPEPSRREYMKLPPELQERAASILLAGPHGSYEASTAADIFMANGRWDMMPKVTERLLEADGALPPEKDLAWATTLPNRPETMDVFRAALDPIMTRNLVGARQWIDTLPSGWQRDLALAEYARSNFMHGDRELYEPALNEIADPRMKASIIQWRENLGKAE